MAKYYVELPADEHGNVTMPRAVVEAEIVEANGREMLVPVAPQRLVDGWPTGWYRDSFGGWVEVEGPARELAYDEHKALMESLPAEARAEAKNGIVQLRNGDRQPLLMVNVIFMSLKNLMETNPIAFYEAVMVARNPSHQPFGNTGDILKERAMLEQDGRMHDVIRSIIISSTEGELLELRMVNPIVG